MNVLVLIKRLDAAPLEREVRTDGAHGEIITFYIDLMEWVHIKKESILKSFCFFYYFF